MFNKHAWELRLKLHPGLCMETKRLYKPFTLCMHTCTHVYMVAKRGQLERVSSANRVQVSRTAAKGLYLLSCLTGPENAFCRGLSILVRLLTLCKQRPQGFWRSHNQPMVTKQEASSPVPRPVILASFGLFHPIPLHPFELCLSSDKAFQSLWQNQFRRSSVPRNNKTNCLHLGCNTVFALWFQWIEQFCSF